MSIQGGWDEFSGMRKSPAYISNYQAKPGIHSLFSIVFFFTKTEITFSRAELLYKESLYIAFLGRFVFFQMKTGMYLPTNIQYLGYIHPCRKTSRFIEDKFRAMEKQQWLEYFCIASWGLFIDWHTSKHPLFTAVNRQRKWIIHESDCNGRNSCEAKSSCQSLSSAILL